MPSPAIHSAGLTHGHARLINGRFCLDELSEIRQHFHTRHSSGDTELNRRAVSLAMMEERRRFFSDLKELKLKGEFINFGHNHDIGLKGGTCHSGI